jgi:uncharacterized DUF497 family protein
VRFDWNDAKREANLHERGFDFAFASLIFDGATFEVEDRRREYGERRMVALGFAEGIHLTGVYTDRSGGETADDTSATRSRTSSARRRS